MEIKGKVLCFFEQSGTFKNEFKKLGYPAEDYDIQNNFGETDHVIDLFKEIEQAYDNKPSIFDNITKDDLIIAFFPCTYFCQASQLCMTFDSSFYQNDTTPTKLKKIIARSEERQKYYKILLQLCYIAESRCLRLVVENPYRSNTHYLNLTQNFPYKPALIDRNRWLRGDYFKKETQYFFINCTPTYNYTIQCDKKLKKINNTGSSTQNNIRKIQRSLISADYARNFICDNILGKTQHLKQTTLF